MKKNILVVDDDEGILFALNMLLRSDGYNPVVANSPEQAIAALERDDFSLILMDLNYSLDTTSGEEGLALISAIRQIDDSVPVVVMTGWGTIDVAVDIMKKGANDFIQKPWGNERLLAIIQSQIKLAAVQQESQKLSLQNQLLREEVNPPVELVTQSLAMGEILETIKQVAKSDISVLFTGENGTGKSLYARYLHQLSARHQAPLIAVNMGAVTESLFESEMFGHIKGAFTDAKSARIGRFELADQGSLFLDEIANTPYSQQGKLLRVLEDRQFEKVGSSKTQAVNIRLITATNSDLQAAVDEGKFRKDLLYRINTVVIEIPPLRRRVEDIIPLAKSFLEKAAAKYSLPVLPISRAAEAALTTYLWPGNVRELSHVMERAQILCKSPAIQVQDLGLNGLTKDIPSVVGTSDANDLRPLTVIEADIINTRLTYFRHDASKAAKSLGMSRSAFYRRWGKARG